jgi:hypothetical protein
MPIFPSSARSANLCGTHSRTYLPGPQARPPVVPSGHQAGHRCSGPSRVVHAKAIIISAHSACIPAYTGPCAPPGRKACTPAHGQVLSPTSQGCLLEGRAAGSISKESRHLARRRRPGAVRARADVVGHTTQPAPSAPAPHLLLLMARAASAPGAASSAGRFLLRQLGLMPGLVFAIADAACHTCTARGQPLLATVAAPPQRHWAETFETCILNFRFEHLRFG